MPAAGSRSLLVDFIDIASFDPGLAAALAAEPDTHIPALRRAAYHLIEAENQAYAKEIQDSLRVRLACAADGSPLSVPLRSLGKEWLNRLISVSGTIVRASAVEAKMTTAVYRCPSGHLTAVDVDGEDQTLKRPSGCESCDETRLELVPRESEFVDYQVMRLQEPPEELPPGQIPSYFDLTLSGDLVNAVWPGDRVAVTGILRAVPNSFKKSTIYDYRIECNHAEALGKEPELSLTAEDEVKLRSIAADPAAYAKLVGSVAPTILGHDVEKEAILLLLAGAPTHRLPDGTRLRGDINVLLVGDPGISKSQLLKFAAAIAPRGVYASGRGSTAAGLSAAVVKEKESWALEVGVTVLADQGVSAIDELDKMRPEDRSAMHEVMEMGSVTIAKAGINATLNARTSVLAAMNPVNGLYNPYNSFSENVNLPPALLSRFDLIFVMRDSVTEETDRRLARHVMAVRDAGNFPTPPPVDPMTLKKYLAYCKRFKPSLPAQVQARLEEFYVALRRLASAEGGIGATPRTLEALIRLSQARARLLFRDVVTEEDAQAAISLLQRMFSQVLIDPKSGKKLDFGQLTGTPARSMSEFDTAMEVFRSLEGTEKKEPVEKSAFLDGLVKTGKFDQEAAEKMFRRLFKENIIYETRPGFFKRVA